ncbi:telomere-associated protein RIF1 isoform X2 [Bradysia coprophila]|nr:telomere-associated protein RIF1 isoform X2 [Bradysia coprophila]XP_037032144.1 telomere-associated protein RIF1 isoform X2 [Bradysia coprophila]XP_037032145.1 telomere-associated protein RIF1 isoform X2 [Bradysia coprophila]XP_037032146.1 telomere-associated protein RIF1 isoform X2 [Bradysia coprophila]
MVSLTLAGVYLEAEKAFKNKEKHLYAKRLDVITSVTQVTHRTPENALTSNQLKFWFQNVIPLIFEENNETQKSAIRAIEAVLPFIRLSSHQDHPDWIALEKRITTEYSDAVIALRDKSDSLWYRMWGILVKLLNKKLLKGAAVINKFLSICENGFKSPNYTTRAETFLCWKVLLEIYSQDAKYLSAKRIKLLLIPFKPIAKTPHIALNKFTVWWSLICKVGNQIDQYYDTILSPFLWFCFGLTDKPILTRSDDSAIRQEIYPELTTRSISALVNLLGPVFNDATSSLCKSLPIERIREPLVMPGLLENVGRFLINSCGEATFLLKEIELVDALPVCENLWSNMMNRMKDNTDPTLSELILQNLTILMNASQNDEPAIKLVTQAASTVLSSTYLFPLNTSNDVAYGILTRTTDILTSNSIQFNEITLKKIIDNLFVLSTETKPFHLQLQQILTLLQSLQFGVRVGAFLWHKVATHILENVTADIDTHKELIYTFIEWAVTNANVDQLTIFLETWKNLARLLLNNEEDAIFWQRINVILRARTNVNDKIIFEFIASVCQLIKPADPFPAKFKSLVETIIKSTPSSLATKLLPIIDAIYKLSEQITGEHSNATYHSLNELFTLSAAKFDVTSHSQFDVFNKFQKNFEKFSKSNNLTAKPSTPKRDEFVFIPSKWQFRPDNLTEHQKEKLKEKRVDIPALYNDMSQSQDSQSISLKPWTPGKNQLQVAKPLIQVVESKVANTSETTAKHTNGALDDPAPVIQQSQSQTDTMASTSLDSNRSNTINPDQQTPSKQNEDERKRRRVQNELNKLSMSITNADEFKNQARTRRMSVNLTKSEQRIRKRALTITDKIEPAKRTRRVTSTSTESENDSSEVIEASQTTPTTRRNRQKRVSLSKTQLPPDWKSDKSVSDTEKPSKKNETNDSNQKENVLPNVSVDSRSIGEETPKEAVNVVIKQTKIDVKLEDQEKPSCATQESNTLENVQVEIVNSSTVEDKPDDSMLVEKSDEAAIPHENLQQSPTENAQLEVTAPVPEVVLTSPVKKHSGDDHSLESRMSGIITSPSSSKDCSKTTELLNSTVNISPIPHAKTARLTDETTESKSHQEASSTEVECSNENIDKDQIKRTDLDNLIKTPMDSPMLQKTCNLPCNSTPQSHKETKRKFPQGRGAQFLQLMNIRKNEEAVQKAKAAVSVSEPTAIPVQTNTPNTNNLPSYEEILASNKDLFRFTKVLPSPLASPSSSIMKRNIEVMAAEDTESPSQKRKRVSFHDPPVSATKEFLRFAEEVNTNRMRINRHSSSPLNARNILTRNSRADSLCEINKLAPHVDDTTTTKTETSVKSLKFSSDEDEEVNPLPLLTFSNKAEVLQHVFDEYPLEDVLGKYFESGLTLNDASSKIFANRLTDVMKSDESKRKLVLEDLSEQFPKEFLDVALEENQISTVIERLPATNMLNYVTDQAKTDNELKHLSMDKFAALLTDLSPAQGELNDDVYQLLLKIISRKMSDTQLLDVLGVLFEKRRTNS